MPGTGLAGVSPPLQLQSQGTHTSEGELRGTGQKCSKARVQSTEAPLQRSVCAGTLGFRGVWEMQGPSP